MLVKNCLPQFIENVQVMDGDQSKEKFVRGFLAEVIPDMPMPVLKLVCEAVIKARQAEIDAWQAEMARRAEAN